MESGRPQAVSGKGNGSEKLHGLCTSLSQSFWINAYVILRCCFNFRYDPSTGQNDDHDCCLCLSILDALSKVEATQLKRSHGAKVEATQLKSKVHTAQKQRSHSPKYEVTQLRSSGHTTQK